jgi:hypothetical protein
MSDLKYRTEEKIDESYTPRAGDRVFWYPTGDPRDKPHAAIVTVDCGPQRVVALSIFYNGVVEKSAVKHMSVSATEIDRRANGGWAWTRTYEPIAVAAPEKTKAKK